MMINTKPAAIRQPVKLNRVGSEGRPRSGNPETLGQRMAARRLDLHLTQAQVARQVRFTPKTGRRRNVETVLSRNAYCMYETDTVEPDFPKLAGIAKALGVSKGWLAFGEGRPEPRPIHPAASNIIVSRHATSADDAGNDGLSKAASEVPVIIIKLMS